MSISATAVRFDEHAMWVELSERPRCGSAAAEQRDELAPFQLIGLHPTLNEPDRNLYRSIATHRC
jgi:hypothetical protein